MKKSILFLWLVLGISYSAPAQNARTFPLKTGSKIGAVIPLYQSAIITHTIVWYGVGTISTCSVKLEQSADNSSWSDLIAGTTCTSNGSAALTAGTANYIRVNATTLTGSGTLYVTWVGIGPGGTPGATVTANIGTTGGLALDATLTGRTQLAQSVAERANGTTTTVTLTVGGTSQQLVAANASRKALTCENPVSAADQGIAVAENLYFDFAGGTVTVGGPFVLQLGQAFGFPYSNSPVPTSAITFNAATTGHKISCFEQ